MWHSKFNSSNRQVAWVWPCRHSHHRHCSNWVPWLRHCVPSFPFPTNSHSTKRKCLNFKRYCETIWAAQHWWSCWSWALGNTPSWESRPQHSGTVFWILFALHSEVLQSHFSNSKTHTVWDPFCFLLCFSPSIRNLALWILCKIKCYTLESNRQRRQRGHPKLPEALSHCCRCSAAMDGWAPGPLLGGRQAGPGELTWIHLIVLRSSKWTRLMLSINI